MIGAMRSLFTPRDPGKSSAAPTVHLVTQIGELERANERLGLKCEELRLQLLCSMDANERKRNQLRLMQRQMAEMRRMLHVAHVYTAPAYPQTHPITEASDVI